MRHWGLFAWFALIVLLFAGTTFADGSTLGEAKRAFAAGDQAYEAGQYLAAARAYENAYELHPLPEITFSMAQAYRRHYFEDPQVAWLETSQSLYRRYLGEQPKGERRAHAVTHLGNIAVLLAQRANEERPPETEQPPPPTELLISSQTPGARASVDRARPEEVPLVRQVTKGTHRVKVAAPGYYSAELDVLALEGRLVIVPIELKARPGSLRVIAEAGADVWVDGEHVGYTPMANALPLRAGRHSVSVSALGRHPVSQVVRIERGQRRTLHVDLERSTQRVTAYALVAGAGGLALVGCAMAILAVVSENQAKDARASQSEGRVMTPDQAAKSNDALARRDLARALSLVSFGASALVGATAALVFVFDHPVPTGSDPNTGARYGLAVTGAF